MEPWTEAIPRYAKLNRSFVQLVLAQVDKRYDLQ